MNNTSSRKITTLLITAFAFFTFAFNVNTLLSSPGIDTELLLNEGSGTTTIDGSGNNHSGTLTNGPLWVPGKYGNAIAFDGINDFVSIEDQSNFTLDPTLNYSWSSWVKNNNFNEWGTVWSQTIDQSNYFYFYAHTSFESGAGPVTNGISVYWILNNGDNKLVVHSTNNVLTAGLWSHVAVTYDGSKSQSTRFTIYVNGIDVTDRNDVVSAGTIATINPSHIQIGANQAYGEYFNGSIDEVRYYRRLLSATEIVADMNSGNSSDIISPTVSITSPAGGTTISSTVNVTAGATDNIGVTGVQFLLDGNNLGAEDLTAPYTVSWNSLTATNGSHTLSARARDATGNTKTSAPVNITVANTDLQFPVVSIIVPSTGAIISGAISVTANASDNIGITGVQFLLDGNNLGSEDQTAPFAVSWNTVTATNGSHTLTAKARDLAGNITTAAAVMVTVTNIDMLFPAVNLTAPASGLTFSGIISVNANATDNIGVVGVQFLLDGNNLGTEDLTAPYSVSWNTATVTDGNHTLSARVRDAAGNRTTSVPVNVTVLNTSVIAAYGFNENIGTVLTDNSGNAYNGALINGPLWGPGKYGSALNFDGSNDFISIADQPNFTLDPTLSYTWSGWVKNNNFNEWGTVWSQTIDQSNYFYFYAHTSSEINAGPVTNGVSAYWLVNDGASKLVVHSTNNVLTAGQWSYIAVTYDASKVQNNRFTIYVNGLDVTARGDIASAGAITTINPSHIQIGANQAYGEYINGSIDEVRYYRRLLSVAEIIRDMNSGNTSDIQSPIVNITSPLAGTTVFGSINVSAAASDNIGVIGVQFLLDGNNLGSEDLIAPYSVSWNTVTAANGSHILTARARDAAGNITLSTGVAVTVDRDIVAPAVTIRTPANGSTVSGVISIESNVSDNNAVSSVQYFLDGNILGPRVLLSPYTFSWNTSTVGNGPHTLTASAVDADGNATTSAGVTVTVSNSFSIISNISVTSVLPSSVSINWNTNVPATTQILYGTTASYGLSTLVDPTLVTAHSQPISGLLPATTYHYKLQSIDINGVLGTSADFTFTTAQLSSIIGTLNGFSVKADNTGKIIPWNANPSNGYDNVMYLAWDYLLNRVPYDGATGKPAYYSRSFFNPNDLSLAFWPHNPAGLYAGLVESGLKYYAYSGNANVMKLAEDVALWHLDHGMTLATDTWASVPYSSGDPGVLDYKGTAFNFGYGVGDGLGNLEPDKIGELATAWLQLYLFNGNIRFRDAAIQAANILSSNIRVGEVDKSPWPFRVNAKTGAAIEEYGSNVIAPIELFDRLIAAGLGNTAAYQTARTIAWNWMMTYPMKNNVWTQYFEDVGIQSDYRYNVNQYNPMMTARYLLEHPEFDPEWETHVRGLITWVEDVFGVSSFGAIAIKEQIPVFDNILGSHTARYASVNALLYEKTGDMAAREKAYRALNWSTYMCSTDGVVIDGPGDNMVWFSDGYGDYIRHFMTGMGAVPVWSPFDQTHLLRSGSVIRNINYGSNSVNYTSADGNGIDVLRVNFTPAIVRADGVTLQQRSDLSQPGWTLDAANKVMKINHSGATQVSINADANAPLFQFSSLEGSFGGTESIYTQKAGAANGNQSSDFTNSKRLEIFPNPASGDISVRFNAIDEQQAVIRVVDLSGRLISVFKHAVRHGKNIINIPKLKPGNYIISVKQGSQLQYGKLIAL